MNTKREREIVYGSEITGLDDLIAKLNKVRAMTNQPISIHMVGSEILGNSQIYLEWDRPLTDKEIAEEKEKNMRYAMLAKEARRAQWEKLNKEFGIGEE